MARRYTPFLRRFIASWAEWVEGGVVSFGSRAPARRRGAPSGPLWGTLIRSRVVRSLHTVGARSSVAFSPGADGISRLRGTRCPAEVGVTWLEADELGERCPSRDSAHASRGRSTPAYVQPARGARLTSAFVRELRRCSEGGGVHRLAAAVILCSGAEGRKAVADGARAEGGDWSCGKPHS